MYFLPPPPNHQIERQSATETLLPITITVTKVLCTNRYFIIFTGAPRDIQRPSKIQLDAELVAVAPSRVDRDQVGSGEDQSVGGRKAALHHLGSGRLKRVTYAQ